jgi:hypothetical protein
MVRRDGMGERIVVEHAACTPRGDDAGYTGDKPWLSMGKSAPYLVGGAVRVEYNNVEPIEVK